TSAGSFTRFGLLRQRMTFTVGTGPTCVSNTAPRQSNAARMPDLGRRSPRFLRSHRLRACRTQEAPAAAPGYIVIRAVLVLEITDCSARPPHRRLDPSGERTAQSAGSLRTRDRIVPTANPKRLTGAHPTLGFSSSGALVTRCTREKYFAT